MSIEYLNHALKVNGLTPTKKFILVILANYADENGSCYPSYRHIAGLIGLKSFKGVQKAIKEFEELGYLTIEHRKLDNGGNTSNRYHLKIGGMVSGNHRVPADGKLGVLKTTNTKEDNKEREYMFDLFWNFYPRKINKAQARKIFLKNAKNMKQVVYAAKRFAEENRSSDLKYIPHPTTWLNQERWNDYLENDTEVHRTKSINNLAG